MAKLIDEILDVPDFIVRKAYIIVLENWISDQKINSNL